MADKNVTPIRPAAHEASFVRGIRTCAEMLDSTCESDDFFVQATDRRGAPQNNVVRGTLAEILARGEDGELEGFCAVLTEICAIADASGDYTRIFSEYADRRERVMRRRYRGARSGRG
jgi:hypothetical protein